MLRLDFKSKKVKRVAIIGVVILLAIILFNLLKKDNTSYLTLTDNLLSQTTGNFRYVIDVRTSKHSDSSKTSTSDLASLEKIEADFDTDKVLEEFKKEENKFVDWGNAQGVELIDWRYPEYKIILEGNIVSKDPLEMNLNVSLATNYISDTLTSMIVKGGKVYINIEQLRSWLIHSKDANFIELGKAIPEGDVYICYEENEFNLYSLFAEASEVDVSRESNIINLINRFIIAEKTVIPKLQVNDNCLSSTDEGIYKINISGADSVDFLKSFKSVSLNIGDVYKAIISNCKKNKCLTEEQYKQALNETDNVVSAFKDFNIMLSTIDLSKLDFKLSGNARNYTGGKGYTTYESSLAFQFTNNNIDYAIAIQMYKSANIEKFEEPTESTIEIEKFKDKDFIQNYIVELFGYLNITSIPMGNQLDITPESIREDVISSFIKLVNTVNSDDESFIQLNKNTVYDFIDGYRDFYITDDTSKKDSLNATLVKDFLAEFKYFLPNDEFVENPNENLEDTSRFPNLIYSCDKFNLYGNLNKDASNNRCLLVDCYILNTSGTELVINTEDFSLQTMQSSKFPANYRDLLLEYDNNFDFGCLSDSITLGRNQYEKVPLYFIIPNGLEYMDLWYGDEKLGVIVSR